MQNSGIFNQIKDKDAIISEVIERTYLELTKKDTAI